MSKLNMNIVKEIMSINNIYDVYTLCAECKNIITESTNGVTKYEEYVDTLIRVKNDLIPKDSEEAFRAMFNINDMLFKLASFYPDNKELEKYTSILTLIEQVSKYEVYLTPITLEELSEVKVLLNTVILKVYLDLKDKKFNIDDEREDELIEYEEEQDLANRLASYTDEIKEHTGLIRAIIHLAETRGKHYTDSRLAVNTGVYANPVGSYTLTLDEKELVKDYIANVLDDNHNAYQMLIAMRRR